MNPKIILHAKAVKKLVAGNLWIFNNDIVSVEGDAKDGCIVDVFFSAKKFFAKGYYNSQSQISIRILTYQQKEIIDEQFFLRRIQQAWAYRQKIGYTTNCRLVFGEADWLPALIVDKFGDYFSIQTLALGIDNWKKEIVSSLQQIFPECKGIYERNDVPVRTLEGLPQQKGFLSQPFQSPIVIEENNYKMYVDMIEGQKTGYFLDQQANRQFIQHLVRGSRVLDAFSYTSSFGISAATNGAKEVTVLDVSEQAILQAKENYVLNNVVEKAKFVVANAFDQLKIWGIEHQKWDVVCIDPPAFTKSRHGIDKAYTGYKEINLRALKLVKHGGFLVTSSCTNLVSQDLFLQAIYEAAKDAKRKIRQVVLNTQSPDHPILPAMENTHYLKFWVLQVFAE